MIAKGNVHSSIATYVIGTLRENPVRYTMMSSTANIEQSWRYFNVRLLEEKSKNMEKTSK